MVIYIDATQKVDESSTVQQNKEGKFASRIGDAIIMHFECKCILYI
jgi:hypothetical protein